MSRLLTVEAGAGYQNDDPFRLFLSKMQAMRDIARKVALEKSYSHRQKPVLVGTALPSVVDGTKIWGITAGHNTKRTGKDKNCSERKAFRNAELAGFTRAIGAVVVSSTSVDEIEGITGLRTATLWPCETCHDDMIVHPVAREDTVFVTGGIFHSIIQFNTAERLRKLTVDRRDDLPIHSRSFTGTETAHLLRSYDALAAQQEFVPSDKRLVGHELLITALLKHKEMQL